MSTAWLQTRNNAHDILAADVLAGDATIEVTTAATQFPVAYPYRVTIWDAVTYTDPGDDPGMEIVQVTGRAGNVLNVTRAQEGTAAAAHTTGDVVRLLVTAGMVQQVQDTIDAHDHSAGGDGAQIAHGSLGSAGSNTHAQIDTHIGSTTNPHSVTAAQAGAATTGDLSAHVGDTGNPHAVSAAQTGAATTGDLSAHTGAANPHSGSASTGDLSAHVGDTGNPHAVSAAQTGAATTGDLSAHTGAANPHSGSASTGDLSAHVGDTGNPHAVSAAQTGAATTGDLSAHTGAANPHTGSASTGDLATHVGNVANPHAVTASQTGAASAGDLSTHIGNVANPHAVSAAQVGAATAQWNASQVQGTAVDAAAIGAGKILKYDGTKLVYAADNDTTDHGALGGLDGDDHTQYHTDGRALTWLGTRSTTDLPEGTGLYHTTARARAAVSASTPLAYDSATGVFSIQQATALQAGYLSAADWATFSAKQAALALPLTHENGGLEADVSAYAGLLKIAGGATSYITDNSAAWDGAAGLAHAAVTVADSTSVDLTLAGQQVSAAVLPAGVDHNALLNYSADRHFLQTAIDHVSTGFATGLLKVTTGTGALSSIADNSANWDAAHSHVGATGASHTYIDQDVTATGSPQFRALTVDRGAVINEGGGDYDTRIEGDTDANLLYIDAGNDRVGIGTSEPAFLLDVRGTTRVGAGAGGLRVYGDQDGTSATHSYVSLHASGGGRSAYMGFATTTSHLFTIANERAGGIRIITNNVTQATLDETGNLGIGTTTPGASSIVDIVSTTKGLVLPRMTTTQRNAIGSPVAGMIIYNTSTNVLNFYNGSTWGAV